MTEEPQLTDLVKGTLAAGTIKRSLVAGTEQKADGSELAIIEGLGSQDYLKEVWFIINGYDYNYANNKYEQVIQPIMNERGIRNFMASLKLILRADFSNFSEDEIPNHVYELYLTNFGQFMAYRDDYELSYSDLNIIHNAFFMAILISMKNGQGAGHRNAVRGVLSEQVLSKLSGIKEQGSSIMSKINPLRIFEKEKK